MKATKLTEVSALMWQDVFTYVCNSIEESLYCCSDEYKSSYKDMSYDDYYNNLVCEVWVDDFVKKGFSIISANILIEDEEDEAELANIFEQARDKVWDNYISSLIDDIDVESELKEFKKEAACPTYCSGFLPIWAKMADGHIELSLGERVSNNTSFYEGSVHNPAKNWVGSVGVWHPYWEEGDAELWAEECHCEPSEFDYEDSLEYEISEMDLDEDIIQIKNNLKEWLNVYFN